MLIGNSVDPLTTAIQLVEFQALEHAGIANDQAIFCQNFLQKHCRQKELKPTTSALIKLHNLGLDKELMFIVKHMEHHNDYIQPIYLTTVLLIMQKLGYPIAKLTGKMLSAEWQDAHKESSPFSSIFCDTLRIVYESGILNSHNAEIYINALIDICMTTWNEACNLNNFKENGELTVEKFEQYILSKLPTNAGATPNALSSKNNPEPSTFEATFFAAARRGLLPIADGGMTLQL